ncbi:MAG: hypothetical protein AAF573_11980 [Bacteroidota bacterium]
MKHLRWSTLRMGSVFLVLLFIIPTLGFGKNDFSKGYEKSLSLSFYNEQISIVYDTRILIAPPFQADELSVSTFYRNMEQTPYQPFLSNLLQYKNELRLNDWLFYELMWKSVERVMGSNNELHKELVIWFLLCKAGYNTRLTHLGNFVFVYAHSEENIFETPVIEQEGKMFINLSSLHNQMTTKGALLNMLPFAPNPSGKSFSFDLHVLPNFAPVKKVRTLSFEWKNNTYHLDVTFDLNLIKMMEHYPVFEKTKYIGAPLSPSASRSLLPQLREIIKGKTEKEALEIIATFTRSAFSYKDDEEYFGSNKPMIADEVFHYPYSDGEDRSALFYFLVKKLLRLPMIAVDYTDHLTIAVATSTPLGKGIHHQNRTYYICDPTTPTHSVRIGDAPTAYEHRPFHILKIKN